MQRLTQHHTLSENGGLPRKLATADFMTRIYSAVVLIAIALFLTLASLESFAVLIAIFTGAMAWEWGRLVRGEGLDLVFGAQLLTTLAACFAAARGCPSCALSIVIGGAVLAFLIQCVQQKRGGAWWSAAGVCYAGFPAVALIWLRSDPAYGTLAILYLFTIVWTTDTAAFLFGRWIGGPKLAPRISPKKTWSGLVGATLASILTGSIFAALADLSSLWLGGLAAGLALIAQFGDLGESGVKRIFGMKDSSSLIPGHGGVLDRIDGLVVVALAAAILAWMSAAADPARALLIWP